MKPKILQFPKNFYWGTATSAYQVEGGIKNDWSEWEPRNAERLARKAKSYWRDWQIKNFPEMLKPRNYICRKACDHYNRFEEDFDLAKKMNTNAYRFSIEWSRVEPEEGKFNKKAVEYYRKVLQALRKREMESFVTLCHYATPTWIAQRGGLNNKKFPFYFSRYAEFVIQNLGNLAHFWLTFNEPNNVIGNAYLVGRWPPQKKGPLSALRAYKIIAQAHNQAFDKIHRVSKEAKVGIANMLNFNEPHRKKSILDKIAVAVADYFGNKKMLNLTKGRHDFLGVQYYFHNRIKFPYKIKNKNREVSDLGWEIYPQGLYHILKWFKKCNLPIYITENGLADAKDEKRARFIVHHLKWIHKAIEEGVDVRGYFHWSLMDNFEWSKGFWPRFGLIEIDYKTLKRIPRPSSKIYAEICKNNAIEI